MSASSRTGSLSAPMLGVDTNVGTLAAPNSATATAFDTEQSKAALGAALDDLTEAKKVLKDAVDAYTEQREAALDDLKEAERALKDAKDAYTERREAELNDLKEAKRALKDAEEAELNGRSQCLCLRFAKLHVKQAERDCINTKQRLEYIDKLHVNQAERECIDKKQRLERIDKLHVNQAERAYIDKKQRLERIERMLHEWKLSLVAYERSNRETMNKVVRTVSSVSSVSRISYDPWENARRNPKGLVSSVSLISFDPWYKAAKNPDGLREKAARHYGYCRIIAKCCLTGITGNREEVNNTHLLPRNAAPRFLDELDFTDVDDARNMILLCNNIGKAFDRQQLCFLEDENDPRSLILKIWDEEIRNKLVFDGDTERRTIGSYSGHKMTFEEGKTPFKRVLSKHAQCSYETAKERKWIKADEPKPIEYGSPLQDDTLTFRKLEKSCSTNGMHTSSGDWDSPNAIDGHIPGHQEDRGSLHSIPNSNDASVRNHP